MGAFLPEIYDMKKPKDVLVVAVLDRLLTDCDDSSYDRLINGLENIGEQMEMRSPRNTQKTHKGRCPVATMGYGAFPFFAI